ncbi:MAG: hypothetical protein BJ554DRAFT_2205 [Olpidium bornovanus]|uniref:Uncharacterized protein n=1 Tax=Olpidium bornovanus TaxID=278681 RepID=A0A8H7ZR98_9FUNG|nr:MAG: hypothetical protein BJ554DRAFT_2205 [Olpidium bornovanus]
MEPRANVLSDAFRPSAFFSFLAVLCYCCLVPHGQQRFVLVSYVPENVSGVRRARALVHGRAVATLLKVCSPLAVIRKKRKRIPCRLVICFKDFEIQVSASKPEDLTEADLKSRLKPRDNSQTAGHGAPGAPPRAKKPKVPKDGADAAAGKGGYLSDGEPPPPSASNEPPQTSPGAPAVQASPVVPARTRVAGGAPWTEALPGVPAEPAPAPAPGIAAEAAAGDEGGRGKAPESAGDRAHEAAAAAAQEEARKVAAAEASKQKAAAAAEAAKKKEEADKRAAEAVRARREAEKGGLAGNQKGWICVQFETTVTVARFLFLSHRCIVYFVYFFLHLWTSRNASRRSCVVNDVAGIHVSSSGVYPSQRMRYRMLRLRGVCSTI